MNVVVVGTLFDAGVVWTGVECVALGVDTVFVLGGVVDGFAGGTALLTDAGLIGDTGLFGTVEPIGPTPKILVSFADFADVLSAFFAFVTVAGDAVAGRVFAVDNVEVLTAVFAEGFVSANVLAASVEGVTFLFATVFPALGFEAKGFAELDSAAGEQAVINTVHETTRIAHREPIRFGKTTSLQPPFRIIFPPKKFVSHDISSLWQTQ